jgi:hypothetical protein
LYVYTYSHILSFSYPENRKPYPGFEPTTVSFLEKDLEILLTRVLMWCNVVYFETAPPSEYGTFGDLEEPPATESRGNLGGSHFGLHGI